MNDEGSNYGAATWMARPDPWPIHEDIGLRVINNVFKRMQLDEEWSVREARGFTWWGHTLAQRVWAERPRLDDDMTITKLHAETDFIRDVTHFDTEALVTAINIQATLSAVIWEPARRRVSFHCTMFVHEEIADWAEELFTHAVALQAADAHFLASGIEESHGEVDETNHPTSGPRLQADEMLAVNDNYFFTQAPSPYRGQDIVTALRLLQQRFLANGDEEAIVAEFPYTDDKPAVLRAALGLPGSLGTALFKANTAIRHPRLGSGALLLLHLPVGADVALANRLNEAERDEWTWSHLLGVWCVGPAGKDGSALTFASFLPAKVRTPSVLINCALNMGLRAKWAGEFLARSSS